MSKLGDWLDERTGHRAFLRHVLDEPVRGGARWAYIFGSGLVLTFVIQAVTGYLLMSAYAPSATTAWSSVAHITFTMRAGWLMSQCNAPALKPCFFKEPCSSATSRLRLQKTRAFLTSWLLISRRSASRFSASGTMARP